MHGWDRIGGGAEGMHGVGIGGGHAWGGTE